MKQAENIFFHNLTKEEQQMLELHENAPLCVCRVEEVMQLLKDRERLEEYEFEKQNRIMERLLGNILKKPEEVEFLLPEINKRYETKLGDGCYQAMIIGVNEYELYSKTSHFLKEVTLLMIRTLNLVQEIIVGYKESYGLIAIMYYGKEIPITKRKKEYNLLLDRIMQLQSRYGEFKASVAVGEMVNGIAEITKSLKDALYAQEYRMISDERVQCAEEIENIHQDFNDYVSARKVKELVRYVSLGEESHVNDWFLEFYQDVAPRFLEYPPAFLRFGWHVYMEMTEKEKKKEIAEFIEWKLFSLQYIFDGKERIRELENILLELCRMMQHGLDEKQAIAVWAIAYMKSHYAEPINLDFMAEKSGFSTSYFSRKFKEQTGEKYIDVLTDIRVREAQRLLGTTELSVSEIVEAVGYCDDKHFRRVFYKLVGMNPLAYRKKIQREQNV